ncbi:hypothetical protein CBL_20294, partial [Carabus blaptoides fortunei]
EYPDVNPIETLNTESESIFSPTLSEEYGESIVTSPAMTPIVIEPSTSVIMEGRTHQSTPTTPAAQSCRGKKRKADDETSDIGDTLSSISHYFKNRKTEDSDLSFGHYVGLELKKLTGRKKSAAKNTKYDAKVSRREYKIRDELLHDSLPTDCRLLISCLHVPLFESSEST